MRTKLQPGLCCERWAQTRSLGCGQKPPALCSLARTQHLPSQPGKNPSDLPPKHPRTQGPGLQGDGISSRAAGPRAQTEAPRLPGPIPRPVTEKQDKTSNVSKGCFSQETTEQKFTWPVETAHKSQSTETGRRGDTAREAASDPGSIQRPSGGSRGAAPRTRVSPQVTLGQTDVSVPHISILTPKPQSC